MKFFLNWWRMWQKTHQKFFFLVAIFCMLALVTTRVFWNGSFPYTHDGENHLARFANYFSALREGQFPPRFAPHLFAGYGFPVFHYNYPLANILALPSIALKQNPENVYSLLAFSAVAVMASSWYFFLRRRFSEQSSWIGVLAILFSSVIQSNLFYRGNIGELWAIALASLFLSIWERRKKKNIHVFIAFFSLVIAAFLLSHNVLAVFVAPFLFLWQLIDVRKKEDIYSIFAVWLLAIGMVTWFWVPALFELSLVVLRSDALAAQAIDHSLTFGQIFLSPLRFGFSRPGPLDNLGWGWGLFVLVLIWMGIGQIRKEDVNDWKIDFKKREKRIMYFFVGIFLIGCFLASVASTFVWKSVPFISIMQFPWRWLSLSVLGLPYMTALVYDRAGGLGKNVLMVSLLIWMAMIFRLSPADRFHKDSLWYYQFPHTSLTRNENRPKTLTAETLPAWEAGPEILEGNSVEVRIIKWTGSIHEYIITTNETLFVSEKTVYFPGWETRVNGKKVEQVFTDRTGGLIAYYVPSSDGEIRVKTSFTEKNTVRLVSELISLLSIVAFGGLVLWGTMMKKKE